MSRQLLLIIVLVGFGLHQCGVIREIKKPESLSKMILLAEILAKDFRYVRVDLYNLINKVYFGELTFSPGAGFCRFKPHEWDRKFGNKLKL